MAEKGRNETVIRNRKAKFEYFIDEVFNAGIVLTGTEVKSLREGKASMQEAYCFIERDEVFIRKMTINEYDKGSYNNHEPGRVRKLLLHKKEIKKIRKALDQKGYSLIPMKIYFNDRNFAKMNIGLGRGKKFADKRETMKERDTKREMDRQMKGY